MTLQSTMVEAQAGVTDFQENMEALKRNFLLSGYFKKRGYEDEEDSECQSDWRLPQGAPVKAFTYTTKQLFDGRDSAKLRNQKPLNAGGEFLAQNQFGFAVVVVSTGMEGDTQKDQTLTEARAMVIRKYLVENFGFDDTQLKTLGTGKQTSASTGVDGDWGSIQILVFPEGTAIPTSKPEPTSDAERPRADRAAQATATATVKP